MANNTGSTLFVCICDTVHGFFFFLELSWNIRPWKGFAFLWMGKASGKRKISYRQHLRYLKKNRKEGMNGEN